jgi:hypothetical protein
MDYHDLPAFMKSSPPIPIKARGRLRSPSSQFARTIEVQNMGWWQLDLETGLWDLGPLDTKNEWLTYATAPANTGLSARGL